MQGSQPSNLQRIQKRIDTIEQAEPFTAMKNPTDDFKQNSNVLRSAFSSRDTIFVDRRNVAVLGQSTGENNKKSTKTGTN